MICKLAYIKPCYRIYYSRGGTADGRDPRTKISPGLTAFTGCAGDAGRGPQPRPAWPFPAHLEGCTEFWKMVPTSTPHPRGKGFFSALETPPSPGGLVATVAPCKSSTTSRAWGLLGWSLSSVWSAHRDPQKSGPTFWTPAMRSDECPPAQVRGWPMSNTDTVAFRPLCLRHPVCEPGARTHLGCQTCCTDSPLSIRENQGQTRDASPGTQQDTH